MLAGSRVCARVIRLDASGSAASGLPFELGGNLIYFFSGLFSGRTGAETLRSMASGSAAIREKGWRW